MKDLGVSDESIFLINFEDIRYQHITDSKIFNGWIKENIPESEQCYVFLDEIQNVTGWELSVSGLQILSNCDVYITGSNSKMLSSELATHISGRYVEIEVMPFSFAEYLEMHPSDDIEGRFRQFLMYGAFPAIDPDYDRRFNEGLLEGVFNTVTVKDILSHMRTDDVSKLTAIARFLFSNIGNTTNMDNIAEASGVSNPTVSKYVDEMCKAFLFHYAERYDIMGKKILKTNGKYYASDLGMRNVILGMPSAGDISRPLENVVYLELLRRGYEVRVGSFRDSEVDFTARNTKGTEYFQVCQTIMAEGTYERKMRTFRQMRDNYPKTVLILDRFGLGSDEGIRVVNVIDWLLGKDRSDGW